MPIRGVLFDVDDTLFDSGSEADSVLAYLRMQGMLDRFPDGAAALGLWRELKERHYARFLNGELTFAAQQRERARELLARIGASAQGGPSDREAAAWFAGYQAHRHASRAPFPDAEPALRALAPGFRLGVVSNSAAGHQRRKLEAIGLLAYFGDRLVCSEQHGAAKPAASIFLAGCAALGLPPHEVAYVGDQYETDALGARRAGLRGFWLDRAGGGSAADAGIGVVHSLEDLRATLATPDPKARLEHERS
ncbi:HAD family hydrolase [Glycomyces sp. A-F 0318]|uniref:HAD family hydrolase n=1 Tax=Glycomyces amatae TaxID=2881355 RepID=UPI001E3942FE|nr:HAD family hydrolase [Glycomyces amatae]MCD0443108.1 HAD family hydrolase [Glycomyces amatae]